MYAFSAVCRKGWGGSEGQQRMSTALPLPKSFRKGGGGVDGWAACAYLQRNMVHTYLHMHVHRNMYTYLQICVVLIHVQVCMVAIRYVCMYNRNEGSKQRKVSTHLYKGWCCSTALLLSTQWCKKRYLD